MWEEDSSYKELDIVLQFRIILFIYTFIFFDNHFWVYIRTLFILFFKIPKSHPAVYRAIFLLSSFESTLNHLSTSISDEGKVSQTPTTIGFQDVWKAKIGRWTETQDFGLGQKLTIQVIGSRQEHCDWLTHQVSSNIETML